MKIISWNVNGLRAVYKKGFLQWFEKAEADIVCLQEIKAQIGQVPPDLVGPKGYLSYFNPAVRPGYAGVAVYTKREPLEIENQLGLKRFDQEGRILHLKYSDFNLINLYLPHGGRQKENLSYKLQVYKYLLNYLKKTEISELTNCAYARKVNQKSECFRVILIGDFNIAHQEIDLARPKDNKNNIMFTLEERKQIAQIIDLGFTDTFRRFNKEGGHYTWWPYFANARERNLGWRIDYVFTSEKFTPKLKNAFILPKVMGSDHCPIGIDINI